MILLLGGAVAVSVGGNSDIGRVTGISFVESFDDFYRFARSLAKIHIGVDTEE